MIDTLAIVGVGLLGGSIALAVRERGLAHRIIGVSQEEQPLAFAQQRGMIDEGYLHFHDAIQEASVAIICTPVDKIAPIASTLLSKFPEIIVSDVGSSKAQIVSAMTTTGPLSSRFIGGHPMAGSHNNGPEYAVADLFQDRLMFLTPVASTSPRATDLMTQFWQGLGSRVVEMDADRHDAIMAKISHLPHIASYVLGGAIEDEYLQYCGTGMRTMTRLAGGDPTMWTAIALSNQQHLLQCMEKFNEGMLAFEQALKAGDAARLHELFTQGRRTHHALGS